ncbi:MAG: YitT family protein [Firmicutes bacterium]|nr:YitT family protein [Bacillota bacterium]
MINTRVEHIVFKGVSFVFGTFLLAMCYNTLLLPNNLVVGGMSGLSIVFQEMFGWNATIFIYLSSIALLIISYIFLGKDVTSNTVIGSLLYPLMISLTTPISNFILERMDVNETIVLVCLAGFFYGLANGIIYKMGFTTGGGDVIMQLVSKYLRISTARANFTYSLIIILLSGYVFGVSALIYAIIILIISNLLIDKIIVGISNSKVFFISTQKLNEVKSVIHDEYDSGFTILPTKSSHFHKRGELIMVVVPNRAYYSFKNRILEIDPKAFFIINDCYEVGGGHRKQNIPFLNM